MNFYSDFGNLSYDVRVYDKKDIINYQLTFSDNTNFKWNADINKRLETMGLPREKDKKLVTGQGSQAVRFYKSEWIDVSEPLVLIEIKDQSLSGRSSGVELDPEKLPFFSIENFVGVTATSSVAELTTGVTKHEVGEKGSWTYYTYIANTNEDILVTLNVDGAGDSDLYI